MFNTIGKIKCFLCSNEADKLPHEGLTSHLFCKNCGEYIITLQAIQSLEIMHEDIKYILSSQTFEKYYYERKPLTILTDHIQNARDITLLEKLYKMSRYLYRETKIRGLGSKIDGISYSQFYCKNNDEYFQALETLKSKDIIDFEKKSNTGGIGSIDVVYRSHPVFTGTAMLAFEEGINSLDDFRRVFMGLKGEVPYINIKMKEGQNQLNIASGNGNITATQNNSLDISELNTLLENVLKSLPKDISNEKQAEVKENLEFIKTEIQNPNPRTPVIRSILFALKGIASTTGFLASLAKLIEYFNF